MNNSFKQKKTQKKIKKKQKRFDVSLSISFMTAYCSTAQCFKFDSKSNPISSEHAIYQALYIFF